MTAHSFCGIAQPIVSMCVCVCVCVRVCMCVCMCRNTGTTLTGQQYTTYKLNTAVTNNPSLSLSLLDTWMKATEKDLMRAETVWGVQKPLEQGKVGCILPPNPYN